MILNFNLENKNLFTSILMMGSQEVEARANSRTKNAFLVCDLIYFKWILSRKTGLNFNLFCI